MRVNNILILLIVYANKTILYQAQGMETMDNLPFIGNVADDTTRATIIIIIIASQLQSPSLDHMFSTAPAHTCPAEHSTGTRSLWKISCRYRKEINYGRCQKRMEFPIPMGGRAKNSSEVLLKFD